jgi:branched-chain amino acid transport system permease protein
MYTLKALAAVVMGGFGHTTGVIYSALIIGIVESLFAGYVSYGYRDVSVFLLMVLVLLIKPQGLFHKKVGI